MNTQTFKKVYSNKYVYSMRKCVDHCIHRMNGVCVKRERERAKHRARKSERERATERERERKEAISTGAVGPQCYTSILTRCTSCF